MPRIRSRCQVWAVAACLGSWFFLLGPGQEAIASLSYRGAWNIEENADGRLLQSYAHLVSLNAKTELIGRLTSEETVNYGYRWGQETVEQERVSPGASLKLAGDIFSAGLSVHSTKELKPNTTQTDSLGFVWASTWNNKYFPVLQANYDYARMDLSSRSAPSGINRQSIGSQIRWDLAVAQLFYSFRRNESDYSAYKSTNDTNLVRVDASRSWLDDRLHLSAGYEYSQATTGQEISFATSNTANVFLTLFQVDTGTDPIPNDTDDSMLAAAQFLISHPDNPLEPTAYAVTSTNNPNCIRLRTNGQQVDRLILYTPTNLGPMPTPLGVNLRIYTNDNILINPWHQLTQFSWVYESVNQRFVIVLPAVRAEYVKLVFDLSVPITINITEVQAEQVVFGTQGSTTTSSRVNRFDRANFNVGYNFNKSFAFYYSLLIAKEEEDSILSNENESHNCGLRMQNSAGDLKSDLSYSLARRRDAANLETQTNSYSLNINKVLLPTLTISLAGSLDETYLDGMKKTTRNRYAFYADARLYPDLNSQLETIYYDGVSYNTVAANANEDKLDTKFTLTSRFSPSLNVSFSEVYGIRNQTAQPAEKRDTTSLSGTWQVSELLSVNVSANRRSESGLPQVVYSYSAGLVAGSGSGYEFKAAYSFQVAESNSQSGLVSLNWRAKSYVSGEIGATYAEDDTAAVSNDYRVYANVTVNFSTP